MDNQYDKSQQQRQQQPQQPEQPQKGLQQHEEVVEFKSTSREIPSDVEFQPSPNLERKIEDQQE